MQSQCFFQNCCKTRLVPFCCPAYFYCIRYYLTNQFFIEIGSFRNCGSIFRYREYQKFYTMEEWYRSAIKCLRQFLWAWQYILVWVCLHWHYVPLLLFCESVIENNGFFKDQRDNKKANVPNKRASVPVPMVLMSQVHIYLSQVHITTFLVCQHFFWNFLKNFQK